MMRITSLVKFYISLIIIPVCFIGCYQSDSIKGSNRSAMYSNLIDELSAGQRANRKLINKKEILSSKVSSALLPDMEFEIFYPGESKDVKRFDVIVKDVQAKEFYMGLVVNTRFSMVVDDNINGTISLNLKNVTINDTLQAARDAYGYEFIRTSYGYRVVEPKIQTQVFQVNYLNVEREGTSSTSIKTGQLTGDSSAINSSISTTTKTNFWEELEITLKAILSNNEKTMVNISPQAGIVVVQAYPDELRAIANYLDHTERNLSRQVILEAKILEVRLKKQYQTGIDWGYLTNQLQIRQAGLDPIGGIPIAPTQAAPSINLPTGSGGYDPIDMQPDFSGIFGVAVNSGNFSSILKLLEVRGDVQVLSSPRISTVNNQKAVIKVGQDEYFVTNVSGTMVPAANPALAQTQTQNINLEPFFSGISLDVTPHIDKDGSVILHVHPTVSSVTDDQKQIQLLGQASTLPLAKSTIRETDNIVRAKNGQVIIIGGLMHIQERTGRASVPGLHNLPLIGGLFNRDSVFSEKTELIVLLRPVSIDSRAWNNDMEKVKKTIRKYKNYTD